MWLRKSVRVSTVNRWNFNTIAVAAVLTYFFLVFFFFIIFIFSFDDSIEVLLTWRHGYLTLLKCKHCEKILCHPSCAKHRSFSLNYRKKSKEKKKRRKRTELWVNDRYERKVNHRTIFNTFNICEHIIRSYRLLHQNKIIFSLCNSICWYCYYCRTAASNLCFFSIFHWNSLWTVINQSGWDIACQTKVHTRARYFTNIEFRGASGICICSGSLSICTPLNSFVIQRRKMIATIYFTTCNCFFYTFCMYLCILILIHFLTTFVLMIRTKRLKKLIQFYFTLFYFLHLFFAQKGWKS